MCTGICSTCGTNAGDSPVRPQSAAALAAAVSGIVVLDAHVDADVGVADLLPFLGRGRIAAIRIKNVISEEACGHFAGKALGHRHRHSHASVQRLDILGVPMYLAARDETTRRAYHESAGWFSPLMRELSEPYGSPLDVMMAVLGSGWRRGVTPLTLDDGRQTPPAILRLYDPGAGVLPHIDDLRQELAGSKTAQSLPFQWGLNVYVDLPEEGGELGLYRQAIPPEEFAKLAGDSYGIPWSVAGPPKVTIRPELGEAILINTRELHCVTPCAGAGHRVTLSAFVGGGCPGQPLWIWS